MAKEVTGNLGNEAINLQVPDFAMESTAQDMLAALQSLGKDGKSQQKSKKEKIEKALKL